MTIRILTYQDSDYCGEKFVDLQDLELFINLKSNKKFLRNTKDKRLFLEQLDLN